MPAPRSLGPRRPPGDLGTDLEGLPQPPISGEPSVRHRPLSPKPLLSAPMKNEDSHCQEGLASLVLDPLIPLGELDRDIFKRSHLAVHAHVPPGSFPRAPRPLPPALEPSCPACELPCRPQEDHAGKEERPLQGQGAGAGAAAQHTGAPGPGCSGDGAPSPHAPARGLPSRGPCPVLRPLEVQEVKLRRPGVMTPGVASMEQVGDRLPAAGVRSWPQPWHCGSTASQPLQGLPVCLGLACPCPCIWLRTQASQACGAPAQLLSCVP